MNKNENLIDIETPPNQESDINNNNNNNSNKNIESLSEQIDLNKDNNNNNESNESSGGESDKSEKKKKKKKKKEKKKDKKAAAAAAGNTTDEDIPGGNDDEIIIKSPILLKSRMRRENDDDHQYSTEMTHFDSPLDGRGNNNNNNGSGTPQIEIDPEMYFDGRKKEKKKKLKKQNGEGGNKDKFLTPEERRIKENSKDAKSFFSNERTFLSWIGLTFSLGAIGTAIITWFGSEGVSLATGVFLWAIAMVFMVYSTLQFRRRGHAIRTKTQGPFDDQKGPLSLVAMVVVGVSIYLVFFVVIRPTVNIGNDVDIEPSNNSTKN